MRLQLTNRPLTNLLKPLRHPLVPLKFLPRRLRRRKYLRLPLKHLLRLVPKSLLPILRRPQRLFLKHLLNRPNNGLMANRRWLV